MFDATLVQYDSRYENSLHYSPKFRAYAQQLAQTLIDRYQLRGKDIIEIACGQGDFLRLLCQLGHNRGLGFDPSYTPPDQVADQTKVEGQNSGKIPAIRFVPDTFGPTHRRQRADLICCRHALEHLAAPVTFLRNLRRSIAPESRPVLFFEVPNVGSILKELVIWDLIYEHPSYFCAQSLRHAFQRAGFAVRDLYTAFADQYLCCEAIAQTDAEDDFEPISLTLDLTQTWLYVGHFTAQYERLLRLWQQRLDGWRHNGRKVVVWGAGSKGVTFLNLLKTLDRIDYVIDINPRKQGRYIPGSGQEVVAPGFLSDLRPDIVIAMNPVYLEEISQQVTSLNLAPEILDA
jgi:2-polyprenyl-3-methyl-5-hydroxy-6-metoxy-1,4-benzoquinol methylase